MTEVDIVGVGVWSEFFADWEEFGAFLAGGTPDESVPLKPELIPARERRRAPLSVKMAVEVMDQACRMAALDPAGVATVFAGVYGDIQITDYMCRTLAESPRAISPTKFHNSVHNAATGYWAIATQSHSPANAISAYSYSPSIALLEGAVQAVEESIPVLVAVQELAAPEPFKSFYDAEHPFSSALLLAPRGSSESRLASLSFSMRTETCDFPVLPEFAGIDWGDNFAARMLPLLAALAASGPNDMILPMSGHTSLALTVSV